MIEVMGYSRVYSFLLLNFSSTSTQLKSSHLTSVTGENVRALSFQLKYKKHGILLLMLLGLAYF